MAAPRSGSPKSPQDQSLSPNPADLDRGTTEQKRMAEISQVSVKLNLVNRRQSEADGDASDTVEALLSERKSAALRLQPVSLRRCATDPVMLSSHRAVETVSATSMLTPTPSPTESAMSPGKSDSDIDPQEINRALEQFAKDAESESESELSSDAEQKSPLESTHARLRTTLATKLTIPGILDISALNAEQTHLQAETKDRLQRRHSAGSKSQLLMSAHFKVKDSARTPPTTPAIPSGLLSSHSAVNLAGHDPDHGDHFSPRRFGLRGDD